jgi:uncharacterized protein (DUF1330 family)
MAAYVIVDTKIHDVERYEEYKALARPIAEKYGGRYLSRGGLTDVVDQKLWSPTRIVLLEFPDVVAARRFMDSDEFAPVKAMRHEYADSALVIIAGE